MTPPSIDRSARPGFRIRTITAGFTLGTLDDATPLDAALRFLTTARTHFENEGYEVQTVRLATQPLASLLPPGRRSDLVAAIGRLDAMVVDAGGLLSIGPLITEDRHDGDFSTWAAELMHATSGTSFSVSVASPATGLCPAAIRAAAETILALSRIGDNGEVNFRFAAAANIPACTPFFPVAYHAGEPSFALGLESAGLVAQAFTGADLGSAAAALQALLTDKLSPVGATAKQLAAETGRRFVGIDVSPAPGLDASIAGAVESLTGQPFGVSPTLTACAAITQALEGLTLLRCGYSGLMLPVLEDRVLARRAAEGRLGLQDLLLCSSVCGTGLDVIPLPGDVTLESLTGLILDVATLATKLAKPLAARLLPMPGQRAGDEVTFKNPHLVGSTVLTFS